MLVKLQYIEAAIPQSGNADLVAMEVLRHMIKPAEPGSAQWIPVFLADKVAEQKFRERNPTQSDRAHVEVVWQHADGTYYKDAQGLEKIEVLDEFSSNFDPPVVEKITEA